MIRILMAVVGLTALLLVPTLVMGDALHGATEPPAVDQEPATNSLCPVTAGETVDESIFLEHEGETVYFCCQRCKNKFIENPEAYLEGLPQFENAQDLHSHEHDHEQPTDQSLGSRTISFVGKFHPVAVHFPIGLLIVALLAEGLAFTTRAKRNLYHGVSRLLINIGAPMAVVTAALGWAAGLNANYPGNYENILTIHRWLGTTAAALAVICLIISELHWRRRDERLRTTYLAALTLVVLLVGVTGHFGATLIYGLEHFKW